MARHDAPRVPAEPTARSQVARRARILRSAADLGAAHGYDGVQMQDVARDAGVALGTVYRYFPSKTQLFLSVFAEEVFGDLPDSRCAEVPEPDVVAEISGILGGWTRRFTRHPQLARAMVRSVITVYASPSSAALELDVRVAPMILGRLGIGEPSQEDLTRIRLLLYAWWGVVIACLNDHMTPADADQHIYLGTALLFAGARSGT